VGEGAGVRGIGCTLIWIGVFYVMPACALLLSSRESRRAGVRWAAVYWLSGATCHLVLPVATGVALWASDILDMSTLRSVSYFWETVGGLVFFQTGFAVSIGILIAVGMARGFSSAVVVVAAGLSSLLLQALVIWDWFLLWCSTILAHIATWPHPPEYLEPLQVALRVGASYFVPPLVAGLCSSGIAVWSARGRGRRTSG
jgi:hypothetical protein